MVFALRPCAPSPCSLGLRPRVSSRCGRVLRCGRFLSLVCVAVGSSPWFRPRVSSLRFLRVHGFLRAHCFLLLGLFPLIPLAAQDPGPGASALPCAASTARKGLPVQFALSAAGAPHAAADGWADSFPACCTRYAVPLLASHCGYLGVHCESRPPPPWSAVWGGAQARPLLLRHRRGSERDSEVLQLLRCLPPKQTAPNVLNNRRA